MRFSFGDLDVAEKVGIGYFLPLGMACLETKKMVSVPSTRLEGRRDLPPPCARRKKIVGGGDFPSCFLGEGTESVERVFVTCNGVDHCGSSGNYGAWLIVESVSSWVTICR